MKRRYLAASIFVVLLVGAGLYVLVRSSGHPARAAPAPRPLSDAPWTANVRVNDVEGAGSPAIAVDASGNAYAVWEDGRNGNEDIYFSYRPAGGLWGTNVKVNDDSGAGWAHYQFQPSIAVDASGNAYAVWSDYRNGDYYVDFNPDIYFSYRPAGGNWGSNVRVNNDAGAAEQDRPSIAVDSSGNAYAVWEDERNGNLDIYFSYRPAGSSWSSNVKVNDDVGTADQWFPSMAVDAGGNAYAVWDDSRNGYVDIYFSYRPAGGTWEANVRVHDDVGGVLSPAIAVDASGNAYAVWHDDRNSDWDIYFSYCPAGGTWGANVRVNDDAGEAGQWFASIAVDASGDAYAVWMDSRNYNPDIYFSHRPFGGTWGPNVRVNDDTGEADQWFPSIAVDGSGNAYAVWGDERDYNLDIYFSYRKARGGPVLQLPFKRSEQSDRCRKSENGLRCVGGYFDHEYPLLPPSFGGTEPTTPGIGDTIVIYTGKEDYTGGTFPSRSRYGYSGHDAYDFGLVAGTQVLAAAGGYATPGGDSCAGKMVQIDHGNGYATKYWHLRNDGYLLKTPKTVAAGERIGSVGQPASRDCGYGYHLHFVTFCDKDKDGRFESNEKIDPYGWAGKYRDPWPLYGGTESTCLWGFGCPTKGVISSAGGGALGSSDGNILVSAPPGAVTDTILLQLALAPDPVGEPSAVPAWHSFALSAQDLSGNPVVDFSEPLTLEVNYSDADVTHLFEDSLSLYSWDDLTSAWLPISTILDSVNNKATANTTHLSLFTLMGQPLNLAPTVVSVSPNSGYSHLDTEITIEGTGFLPTPSVRLGLNELAVTFIDSATLTAVVPSGLDPGVYDLTVMNPDAQEYTLESAFTVLEPLKVYLPLTFKNY